MARSLKLLPRIELRGRPEPLLGGARLLGRRGDALAARAPLVVGTIRMGYGHYRMGRAAATWGVRAGRDVFVHDPLAIASLEASLLRASEWAYSAASRLSSELGGPVERAWGRLMKTGGRESQAASRRLGARLARLMDGLPRDWPVVCAHPWNAHLAVECGFTRVVNLVPDNFPQHFLVVPGALNLAQCEESRRALLALGVPAGRTDAVGHWVPAELAENATADGDARLERLKRGAPPRVLVSIGGAGGQGAFLERLLRALSEPLAEGRLRLLLNAGDHAAMLSRFERLWPELGLPPARLDGAAAVDDFVARHPLAGPEPAGALVSAAGPLEAVAATDRLMRAADILITKPSELAFFPIPKLHIRRVGDHEAPGARYSAELGDGTPEQREPDDAAALLRRWLADPEELARLNEGVKAAARRGVYHGAEKAVARALSLR